MVQIGIEKIVLEGFESQAKKVKYHRFMRWLVQCGRAVLNKKSTTVLFRAILLHWLSQWFSGKQDINWNS